MDADHSKKAPGARMKTAIRLLAVCVGFSLMGLALASPVAFAEGSLGGTGGSPLESPLVVPEGLPLTGSQSVEDAEEARSASPEAVVARQESQTKYEGLGAEEAAKLVGEVFPGVVDHPAGGLPQLPEGRRITAFVDANAADVGCSAGALEAFSGVSLGTSLVALLEASPARRRPKKRVKRSSNEMARCLRSGAGRSSDCGARPLWLQPDLEK
jgi:hypothetical protein